MALPDTLVLFDIDGTLVRGGPAKDAFHSAMVRAFGTAGAIHVHEFAGKTDPQIARELLTGAGLSDEQVEVGFPVLWEHYIAQLESMLVGHPMQVIPGVAELLDALDGRGAAMGLVTGNIAPGARLKLSSAGLHGRFHVGGYGSDHERREHLPRVAMDRALEAFGVTFSADRVIVIGDTPRDVACGLHEGVRTLGVATGSYDVDSLACAGAHAAFADLTDTEAVLRFLLG
jgi:phosphoglycolate phosphatase